MNSFTHNAPHFFKNHIYVKSSQELTVITFVENQTADRLFTKQPEKFLAESLTWTHATKKASPPCECQFRHLDATCTLDTGR